jgi:hypothetical protein
MMKLFWGILTIGLILVGFFFPPAWIGAVVTGLLAIVTAPSGRRADGMRCTGGLLGGLWDDVAVSRSMMDCPHCKSNVSRKATKCPHCQEWLSIKETAQEAADGQSDTLTATESVKGNLAKLGPLEMVIVALVAIIGIGLLSRMIG